MGGLHFCILDKKFAPGSSDFVARSIEVEIRLRNQLPLVHFKENPLNQPMDLRRKTMKSAKSLGAAVVLTLVIAISGLATPPCSPGQIETPP
jgi:hypothetical protein